MDRKQTRLSQSISGPQKALAAALTLSACIAACSDHPIAVDRPGVVPPGPNTPSSCLDTDQDGFISEVCGGDDCNDTEPYINPAAVDGPWHHEIRYVGNEERVRWFSIDGAGNAHWMTKIANDLHSSTSLDLRYARGDGVSFGIPNLVDDSQSNGAQVSLWTGYATVQALLLEGGYDGNDTLRFVEEASDWLAEPVVTEVTNISELVQREGQWHTLYTTGEGDNPQLHHAIRSNGTWSVQEMGTGSPDGLFLTHTGELQMISSTPDACFQHGRWIDGSWVLSSVGGSDDCIIVATAMSSAGHLYVLYWQRQGVHLMTDASGSWEALTPPPLMGPGSHSFETTMLVDDVGTVHLMQAHQLNMRDDRTPLGLWYLNNSSHDWAPELVGYQISAAMALDTNGDPVIAFSRTVNLGLAPQLVIARRTGNDGIDQNCNGMDGS